MQKKGGVYNNFLKNVVIYIYIEGAKIRKREKDGTINTHPFSHS